MKSKTSKTIAHPSSQNGLKDRTIRVSLYIFLGLLGYTPLHILISTWVGTSFGVLEFAKVAKDVVLIIGFLPLLFICRKRLPKQIKDDKLLWLITGYGLLTIFLAVVKPTDTDAEILGIVYNLRFLVFFVYGLLLTKFYQPKWLIKRSLQFVLISAFIVMAFGIVQYLWLPDDALTKIGYSRDSGALPVFHIDDKPDLERIMSTVRDPNSLGSYIVIIMSIVLVYLLSTKNKDLKQIFVGLSALALLCLWFTFSRSAWIGAVISLIAVFTLFYTRSKKLEVSKKYIILAATLLISVMTGFYLTKDTYFVKNVILHADESTVLEDPNELRLRFWQESLDSAVQNPIGYGPGTAGLASIRNQKQGTILNENYYLQILHEVGLIGLVLFVGILLAIAYRLNALYRYNNNYLALALLASLAGLMFTNFLVHIWSNEAVAYTWWGLAGLIYSKE